MPSNLDEPQCSVGFKFVVFVNLLKQSFKSNAELLSLLPS